MPGSWPWAPLELGEQLGPMEMAYRFPADQRTRRGTRRRVLPLVRQSVYIRLAGRLTSVFAVVQYAWSPSAERRLRLVRRLAVGGAAAAMNRSTRTLSDQIGCGVLFSVLGKRRGRARRLSCHGEQSLHTVPTGGNARDAGRPQSRVQVSGPLLAKCCSE